MAGETSVTLSKPEEVLASARNLAGGAGILRRLNAEGKTAAVWSDVVGRFRDPASPEHRNLLPRMTEGCRLTNEALQAGLDAVLGGVDECSARVFEQARLRTAGDGPAPEGLVVVWLASNVPGLAVQPLLPILAAGRPVLLKSPSSEPHFVSSFVRALVEREPELERAIAAHAWEGGDTRIEEPLLRLASRVLVYGESETIENLEQRAPGKVFGFGPKTSLAVVEGAGGDAGENGSRFPLVRDVALFDQRGCLSITTVYVIGGTVQAARVAETLRNALARKAREWPPAPPTPAEASAVQQVRGEADLLGLHWWAVGDELGAGTVIVDPVPTFCPGPGLRTVRVHPLPRPEDLPAFLAPWQGRLQGAALAGAAAWALEPALRRLGVSRCAPPGELQSPDALWHNGGVHPMDLMWE